MPPYKMLISGQCEALALLKMPSCGVSSGGSGPGCAFVSGG